LHLKSLADKRKQLLISMQMAFVQAIGSALTSPIHSWPPKRMHERSMSFMRVGLPAPGAWHDGRSGHLYHSRATAAMAAVLSWREFFITFNGVTHHDHA
jgi:hypothetical protein